MHGLFGSKALEKRVWKKEDIKQDKRHKRDRMEPEYRRVCIFTGLLENSSRCLFDSIWMLSCTVYILAYTVNVGCLSFSGCATICT